MTLYAILAVALAVWIWGLWRRGFFGAETPSIVRRLYYLRLAIWFASMLIVSIPLRQQREHLGTITYVALAFAILVLFYWLGAVLSRAILKRYQEVAR